MISDQARIAVVKEALTWYGTKYQHQARLKGVGVDCLQFVLDVYHKAGLIPLIIRRDYPVDWHMHTGNELILSGIEPYLTKLHRDQEPRPGDIALFRYGRSVSHFAIVEEWPIVLHSYYNLGVVRSSIRQHPLQGRLHGVYTL